MLDPVILLLFMIPAVFSVPSYAQYSDTALGDVHRKLLSSPPSLLVPVLFTESWCHPRNPPAPSIGAWHAPLSLQVPVCHPQSPLLASGKPPWHSSHSNAASWSLLWLQSLISWWAPNSSTFDLNHCLGCQLCLEWIPFSNTLDVCTCISLLGGKNFYLESMSIIIKPHSLVQWTPSMDHQSLIWTWMHHFA